MVRVEVSLCATPDFIDAVILSVHFYQRRQ